MEPTLLVIGINHRTSPVEIREKFWMGEARSQEVLRRLAGSAGIEEALVLVTCNRTEFILWTSDFSTAASTVLSLLTESFGLRFSEWKHFYQLLDETALLHVFRVASSLDSMLLGEPQIVSQVKAAWARAQAAGTTGRFLDAILQKAISVSKMVRNKTQVGAAAVSVPSAAVEVAEEFFESLAGLRVLILGGGKMGTVAARNLKNRGIAQLWVINSTYEHAVETGQDIGAEPVRFEDRAPLLEQADIVICSTGCPHVILSREEIEQVSRRRDGRPLLLVDIALPRDVDPAVRGLAGVMLYDLDDLRQAADRNLEQRQAAAVQAEKMAAAEAHKFYHRLSSERVVPTISALRERLDEICRREVERLCSEDHSLSNEEQQALVALGTHISHRLAGLVARELREVPLPQDQQRMAAAVEQLFHLNRRAAAKPLPAGKTVTV